MKTDVIIVGAGPTGLSLACQLVRYGIDFVIIEKNQGVTPLSKALGVQSRTMEIYEQLGLAQKAIDKGEIARSVRLISDGKIHDGFDLSRMGQGVSPYPYMLVLEQSKNEQMLYDYLQAHQREVMWNTAVESFSQNEDGVRAIATTENGEALTIEGQYLVGCDGASSVVRKSLGMPFLGDTMERLFYVADAEMECNLDHDTLHSCLGKDYFLFFFPMPEEKSARSAMPGSARWRILGNLPENEDAGETFDIEAAKQLVKTVTKLPIKFTAINWFSTYNVHTRRAEHFKEGRIFLAGDSAHVHTPAGGQGMNTGIQDAYNLAWKLGFVLNGQAEVSLLDTYDDERVENAKNLVQSTDRLFELEAGGNRLMSLFRTMVVPPLAKYIFSIKSVQRIVFSMVSQTGINYEKSPLTKPLEGSKLAAKAGDRMPYCLIEGESLYKKLYAPKFHLIQFITPEEKPTKLSLDRHYDNLLQQVVLPLSDSVSEAFDTKTSFSLLLRPDNYIGFITQEEPDRLIEQYFSSIGIRSVVLG